MVSFKCLFTTKVLVCYFSRNMQTGAKKLYNSIYVYKESFLSLPLRLLLVLLLLVLLICFETFGHECAAPLSNPCRSGLWDEARPWVEE